MEPKANFIITFCVSISLFAAQSNYLFSMKKDNVKTSKTFTIKKDSTWQERHSFIVSGNQELDGNNHTLTLDGGTISIQENSTLYLRNITIKENKAGKFKINLKDTSTLILENVTWEIKGLYTFENGHFIVKGNKFLIENKNKKAVFVYSSKKPSSVQKNAQLLFNNIVLLCFTPNCFALKDVTSVLSLTDTVFMHSAMQTTKPGTFITNKGISYLIGAGFSSNVWKQDGHDFVFINEFLNLTFSNKQKK